MRAPSMAAIALGISLLGCQVVQAGVYNTAEPMEGPASADAGPKPLGFSQFQDILSTLLGIGVGQPLGSKGSDSPKRAHYLARRDELQAKARTGRISVEERVDLGAYLIRLRQYEEAVQALEPAAAQERQNVMLFANLATAHQLTGRLERAVAYLQQATLLWPLTWPGLTKEQLLWFRTAERYHVKLLTLRLAELAWPSSGRGAAHEKLDNLFPLTLPSPPAGGEGRVRGPTGPLRFVGESGQYEAGKLAVAERAKLPAEALAIVQQLVIWLPEDTRLYWLLGELYNANGDIGAAARIFDECVGNVRRFSAPELRAHRLIVLEAKPKADSSLVDLPSASPESAPTPSSRPSWLPESRQLVAVATIAALAVVLLGYFQVREMRRRRMR